MSNMEKWRARESTRSASDDSVTSSSESAEHTAKQKELEGRSAERHEHDAEEASQLLETMREKYGDRFSELHDLKPGDDVYTDGHMYRIEKIDDSFSPSHEVIDPVLKSTQVEMQEKAMDTQLEMATRAGLSGSAAGGGIGSISNESPLERRARIYDNGKREAEAREQDRHDAAQRAVQNRRYKARRIDGGSVANPPLETLHANDVAEATPELKERIKKTDRAAFWRRLNPFA